MKKNRFSSKPPIDRHSFNNPSSEDYKVLYMQQEKLNEKLLAENIELKKVNSHMGSELTNYQNKLQNLKDEIHNLKKKLSNYENNNITKLSNEKKNSTDDTKEKIRSFLEEKKTSQLKNIDRISDSTTIKGILIFFLLYLLENLASFFSSKLHKNIRNYFFFF